MLPARFVITLAIMLSFFNSPFPITVCYAALFTLLPTVVYLLLEHELEKRKPLTVPQELGGLVAMFLSDWYFVPIALLAAIAWLAPAHLSEFSLLAALLFAVFIFVASMLVNSYLGGRPDEGVGFEFLRQLIAGKEVRIRRRLRDTLLRSMGRI